MANPIPSTSGVAPAIAVQGFQLQAGNGASPEVFTTVCNVSDFTLPGKADVVDVTNVGNLWRQRIPTLLDLGEIKFKIFWVMEEATHENAVSGNVRGLRYLWINRIGCNWKAIYQDANSSTDYFYAYVTGWNETGKVGDTFTAEVTLSNAQGTGNNYSVPILQ